MKKLTASEKYDLQCAFAENALEGQDNPKVNQYIINQMEKGLTEDEIITNIINAVKTDPDKFFAQFK